MARVKLWRLGALMGIPLLILVVHGRLSGSNEWHGRDTFHSSVQGAVRQLAGRIRTAEFLEAEVRSASSGAVRRGPVIALREPKEMDSTRALARAIRAAAEVTSLPGAGSHAVDVILVPRSMPDHSHGRQSQWQYGNAPLSNEIWNPCIVSSENLSRHPAPAARARPALTGQCALAAAYGEPGMAMRGWIRRLALYDGQPAFAFPRYRPRDEAGRIILDEYGQWSARLDPDELVLLNCRSGDTSVCRFLLDNRHAAGLRGEFAWWLLNRDGAAFGTLWRSDGDLQQAARATFGLSLDSLFMTFSREQIVIQSAGPALPKGAFTAIVWIVLPLALAALTARRKTILG